MFANAYGWTKDDVLDLTFSEIFKFQEAMMRRFHRVGQKPSTDGNINWERKPPVKKIHEALGEGYFSQFVVEE
jgi:hypothetical protein